MQKITFYRNQNQHYQILERNENAVLCSNFYNFFRNDFDNESDAAAYFNKKEAEFVSEKYKKVTIKTIEIPEEITSFDEAIRCFNLILESEALFSVSEFLKKINKTTKTQFVKELKLYRKYLSEYIQNEKGSWKRRGTDLQIEIIALAAMALMNKTDVKSWDEVYALFKKVQFSYIEDVLNYFKPTWINDFILDKTLKSDWGRIQYEQIIYLEKKELLKFNPELFALTISEISFWNHTNVADIKFLYENEITYQRDVKLLFEYPTNINNFLLRHEEGVKTPKGWHLVFELLVSQHQIDRLFVIERCIDIQNKNWNNGQLTFFRGLLENLKPAVNELVQFQNQLFLLLSISNKTVYNFAIKQIKKIAFEDGFQRDEFIEWTATILTNFEAKTSIISILQIFDKYLKKFPELREDILLKISDVFIINDYELQQRAAALVVKHALKEDEMLIDNLLVYKDQMIGGISKDLAFLMGDTFDEVQEVEIHNIEIHDESLTLNPIPVFTTWDDLFYAIGAAINSDNPIDFEIVLNAFLTQKNLFPPNFETKLDIYKKTAKETYKGKAARYDLTVLLNLMLNNGSSKVKFTDDKNATDLPSIRKHLINYVFSIYNAKHEVSLLSMPTHLPYYIEANTLLERLIEYEAKQFKINPYDLMMALNRCIPKFDTKSHKLIDQLSDKYKQLFLILSEKDDEKALEISKNLMLKYHADGKRNWFQKTVNFLVRKNKFAAKIYDEQTLNHFEITKKSYFDCLIMVSRLRLPFANFEVLEDTFYKNCAFAYSDCKTELSIKPVMYRYADYDKKIRNEEKVELYGKFSTSNVKNYYYYCFNVRNVKTFYNDYWDYAFNYSEGLSTYDSKTYFGLMPFYTEPIFASLFANEYRRPSFFSETTSVEILKQMLQPSFKMGYFSNWYLACSQFADKKEVRLFSTEVLIELINKNLIDDKVFAQRIVELTETKYATVQRLIENLLMLKDISVLHNKFLATIVENLLLALTKHEKPPTNTKKIIEILYDLNSKSDTNLNDELRFGLEKWKGNATLKKLIDNVLKL